MTPQIGAILGGLPADAALRMSQALNAAIIASALDCIVVIDEAGGIVEFNPAAEEVFGHRRDAVLGRGIAEIIVPPHLRARHAAGFARYLATGQAQMLGKRIEIEGMRADGTIFPLELTITEVRLPGQRLFTAYLRDLTAARRAAAELQRSRDALHQSEKMAAFGSLLAGVAHELNNPLSIVIGNALMLSEDAAGVERHLADRATRIHLAAERCARVVRSFLAMARQRPIMLRPFDIAPLLRESIELLGYGLRTGGIAVTLDLPQDLPPVIGDPDQLNQVIVNLLVNAQQALAARPGPRRITIGATVDEEALTLTIVDNSPGVPDGIRHRIFDPFFTTKPTGLGTGIGLAVSRGIAEAHGGRLDLAPPGTGGACFTLRLRRAMAAVVPPVPSPDLAPRLTPGPPASRRALIVDDEPEVAAILAELVAASGFRCDIAVGGTEGCRLLENEDYDAILCDLHMPQTDGPALFAWMSRQRPRLCGRVIFITADTLGQAATDFLAQSGRPVLEKPFVPAELRRLLRSLDSEVENLSLVQEGNMAGI